MTNESFMTAEVRALVGRESGPVSEDVSGSAVRRFAQATFDDNPLHTDEYYTAKGPEVGLVAPPAFFLTLPKPPMEAAQQLYRHLEVEHTTVAGGDEWEFFERIQPGDVITSRSRLVDTYEKQGRPGLMLFLVTETTYTNQRDEMVVRARSTIITY